MAKKQFKAESKRLLDLMVNSIYTHKEIFLRELISNASDAADKLAYLALTDERVGLSRADLKLRLTPDVAARTLTLSDNGIGMTKEELEENLGTIACSGSRKFRDALEEKGENAPAGTDIIGQFGVGFYAAFMVADKVSVTSRAFGSDKAFCWVSDGADGYTVAPCEKETVGTDVVLHLKENTEQDNYDVYLQAYHLDMLVKKYSDYIHYPIQMETEHSHEKPRAADAPEDAAPEFEKHKELETLNSMVPLWQKGKGEVTQDEYNEFYMEKFGDWVPPLTVLTASVEGAAEYKAMLFIPAKAPQDFYSREYEKGLQLYSSGVLIMDKCADLVPDCFSFVRGVVESPDLSLNISRELLQKTQGLKIIATNLEKKIKAELLKMQADEPEKYEQFWNAFGRNLKYGVVSDYGVHKDLLRDLLLFCSSFEGKNTTLAQYVARMPAAQEFVYYLCGESAEKAAKLPQAERILAAGYEILYLTDEVDQFTVNALAEAEGKAFKNVSDGDALAETDAEKAALEQQTTDNQDVLDFVKETLGEQIKCARISKILQSGAVCLTSEGPVTIEMEKYFQRIENPDAQTMKAERVLELNPNSGAFAALRAALDTDKAKAADYAQLLYAQALLLAGLQLSDPAQYTALVCSLMQ